MIPVLINLSKQKQLCKTTKKNVACFHHRNRLGSRTGCCTVALLHSFLSRDRTQLCWDSECTTQIFALETGNTALPASEPVGYSKTCLRVLNWDLYGRRITWSNSREQAEKQNPAPKWLSDLSHETFCQRREIQLSYIHFFFLANPISEWILLLQFRYNIFILRFTKKVQSGSDFIENIFLAKGRMWSQIIQFYIALQSHHVVQVAMPQ